MTALSDVRSYIIVVLGGVGTTLSLTTTSASVINAAAQVSLDCDDDLTDERKWKAIARVQAWQIVLTEIALDYDFKDDKASYNRSQMYKMASDRLLDARREALAYLPEYQVGLTPVTYNDDPYRDDNDLTGW
jgi:hypothetical protein